MMQRGSDFEQLWSRCISDWRKCIGVLTERQTLGTEVKHASVDAEAGRLWRLVLLRQRYVDKSSNPHIRSAFDREATMAASTCLSAGQTARRRNKVQWLRADLADQPISVFLVVILSSVSVAVSFLFIIFSFILHFKFFFQPCPLFIVDRFDVFLAEV
jgi:hypothetical protein